VSKGTETTDTPTEALDLQPADTVSAPAEGGEDTPSQAGKEQAPASAEPQAPEAEATTGEDQPLTPEETLLAGKYRSAQDLEKGYKELERKLSEQGREVAEVRTLREKLEAIERSVKGQEQAPQPEAQDWQKEWESHPLSKPPDAARQPEDYKRWFEETFTPYFYADPAGTIRHAILPELQGLFGELMGEMDRRDQARGVKEEYSGFFNSKTDWTGDKTVNEALSELSEDPRALEAQYQELMSTDPAKLAAEVLYRRGQQQPLVARDAAVQARDEEERALASGAPNRGPAASATPEAPGEGETLSEMMHSALAKQGTPLEGSPRRILK
jgi:hypothetical protein